MKTLRFVLFGLAVCVLAALGWRLSVPLPRTATREPAHSLAEDAPQPPKVTASLPQSPAAAPAIPPVDEARRSVERRLAEVPQYAAVFTQLGGAFPHLRDRLLDQWAMRLSRSGVLASPETLIWQAVRDVQQSQGVLARRASDEALTAYFDARLALLDAMAPNDPKLCADFLYGSDDGSIDAFSTTHHDLVANLASRQLTALTSGQDHKADPAVPTGADFDLVAAGLADKGLGPDEIGVLIDGRTLDPPPSDARMCEMGRIYLSVLRTLPLEPRTRIYGLAAELLARS